MVAELDERTEVVIVPKSTRDGTLGKIYLASSR